MTDSSSNSDQGYRIHPGRAAGRVAPPASKSASHRALNLAVLAGGGLDIRRPLVSEDIELFLAALPVLGVAVERIEDGFRLARRRAVEGGRIECGNAGTLLRFLVATASVLPGRWVLDGSQRMRERPVGPLVATLRCLGARIRCPLVEGYPPLEIEGGYLHSGSATLDAGESSQYLSALLMAGQGVEGGIELEVESLASAPYVELTLQALATFGGLVERDGSIWRLPSSQLSVPEVVEIEADDSAAAYPAAMAALTGGRVEMVGLRTDSKQGDRRFLALLESMGARVSWRGGTVVVQGGRLEAVRADLSELPDQVPTLAALAPFARGRTEIVNVAHLRIKESDRLAAMASELTRVGAVVEERSDGLVIPGIWADEEPASNPVLTESWKDHRIAMSMALVGLRRPGITVGDPRVVGKSYPGFWRDLEALVP